MELMERLFTVSGLNTFLEKRFLQAVASRSLMFDEPGDFLLYSFGVPIEHWLRCNSGLENREHSITTESEIEDFEVKNLVS